jgi:hypothetical protein
MLDGRSLPPEVWGDEHDRDILSALVGAGELSDAEIMTR